MFLVGDIGNTETKICLLNNRYKKIKKITLNTQKLSMKYLTHKTLLIKKNFKMSKSYYFQVLFLINTKLLKNFLKLKQKKILLKLKN